MKERPIHLLGHEVRAILEGRKTVTRRPVKARLANRFDEPRGQADIDAGYPFVECDDGYVSAVKLCPYGQPGDRLWVRETWARIGIAQAPDQEWVVYRESDNRTDYGGPWKPGIHMFRRDSRILLEITGVRVERLQNISEDQSKAEGVRLYTDHAELGDWYHVDGIETYSSDPRKSFELLWSSINGAESWNANPWVWVVEFRRVTP
ncbi:hypothetical protein NUH87_26580 [Pseudomonas batumici]|uniref:hypothetical protein n=1 Tax=Pseudomonas batumici TaxID=226910 RepID=UPI0030D02F44